MRTAPMPRRQHHQAAAAYTNATDHPQRGRHRTTRCKSGSVRSPGSCKPRRRVRRPVTNAPGPRSRFSFLLWARRPLAAIVRTLPDCGKTKGTSPISALLGKQSDGVTPFRLTALDVI
jgi:hypothetical protein